MHSLFFLPLLNLFFLSGLSAQRTDTISDCQFEEIDGIVSIEAEHFQSQTLDEVRRWYVNSRDIIPPGGSDGDDPHWSSASNKAYLEILPDTRRTHDDKLIQGENFSNEPGKLGVLNYHVYFHQPGRYYVWVRAFSTGTEDNGLHVGLNGEWVSSGQRMQWCEGKNQWTWASKQRTKEEHCGVEKLIYLDIPSKGPQIISFSMREDGFEFDKFVLSREYIAPEGKGPPETLYNKNHR